ncbi:MAG: PadR family transcriptional regulator [Gammaproteobacteria bacterium]|nr:PadR family transcriptional regulator [Gammaproteobacteria bacterium]MDE2070818.1 PadR family transcriptional regulator [Gammaproteobacteria bacterium]
MNEEDSHLRKFQKELNAGIVALVLLATLAYAPEPQYGYQIAKQLEPDVGENGVMKQGTLYPVLRSLFAARLLDSYVEPSVSGPPRRYYTITDTGRTVLAQWKDAWTKTRDLVDAIMKDSRHD